MVLTNILLIALVLLLAAVLVKLNEIKQVFIDKQFTGHVTGEFTMKKNDDDDYLPGDEWKRLL